jgi:hypothetical protein
VTKELIESGPRTAVAVFIGPTGMVFAYGPPESPTIRGLAAAGVAPMTVPCPRRNPVAYMAWIRSN